MPPPPVGIPSIRTGSHLWGMPPMDRLPFVGCATSTHGPPSGGVPVDQDRLPLVGYATSKHGPPSGGVPVDQDRLPLVGYATNGQAPIRGVCHQHRPEYGDFYHPTSHLTILKRSQSQCPTVPAMIPVGATANVAVSKQSMTVQCRSAQCHTAPTAQHGLLFHGNMTVLCRSTARCPGTLLVRSPLFGGSTTVQCRFADRCSGTYSPVRSPFRREYNRTVQIC
jgi:hypothetical protein